MRSMTGLSPQCFPSSRAAAACASASFPSAEDPTSQMHRLEDSLNALEEELRKIDAFRRELPLCMQLLHDAIQSYKERLAICKPSTRWTFDQSPTDVNKTGSRQPSGNILIGLESDELLQMKKGVGSPRSCNSNGDLPPRSICKPQWMTIPVCSSIQGESTSHLYKICQRDLVLERASLQNNQEQAFSTSSKPFFHSKTKSGGAFTPFSRDKQVVQPTPCIGSLNPEDVSLSLKDQDVCSNRPLESAASLPYLGKANKAQEIAQQQQAKAVSTKGTNGQNESASARKARRCWSPELHRRFVSALQQLGGCQVATPKQIRELMKVEGLTNDEVKSHLQKYRLHTRRPSSPQSSTPQSSQVVVLGGIWVPPEYVEHAASQQAPSLYNSSQQQNTCQTATSQELCSELGSIEQTQLHSTTFNGEKPASAHSQSSLHSSVHLAGHSASAYHGMVENGKEQCVYDEEGSNDSSCKGCPRGYRICEMLDVEDDRSQGDSISGFRSHCTSEDEDSQGTNTSLKLVC